MKLFIKVCLEMSVYVSIRLGPFLCVTKELFDKKQEVRRKFGPDNCYTRYNHYQDIQVAGVSSA